MCKINQIGHAVQHYFKTVLVYINIKPQWKRSFRPIWLIH